MRKKSIENIKIINCYGPTECTFAITSVEITKEFIDKDIPIGLPKNDVEIFVLNEYQENAVEGQIGEIVVCGESVAAGYVQDNIDRNGFRIYNGKKCYFTGDFGYWKNNQLYYTGRQDNQIKFRGYRIELTDIENVLYKYALF